MLIKKFIEIISPLSKIKSGSVETQGSIGMTVHGKCRLVDPGSFIDESGFTVEFIFTVATACQEQGHCHEVGKGSHFTQKIK